MTKATTMTELAETCKNWQSGDDGAFAQIVRAYLDVTGNDLRVLADEFEAALSTVSRWANGHARPRPRTQREIVEWIGRKAVKSAKSTSYAASGSPSQSPLPLAAKGN